MKELIISMLFGMLPDCLYYTFFWIVLKKLNNRRIQLFILICVVYLALIMIQRYEVLYYFLFVISIYGVVKVLYKEKINFFDIFIFGLACLYMFFDSCFCMAVISKYEIAYIINKILLIIPFIFHSFIERVYKKYLYTWNRETNYSQNIKSITLRIGTVVIFSCFIFISSKICIYINS